MYTVQCTGYTLYCRVYTVNMHIVYRILHTVYTVFFTLYNVQWSMYREHYIPGYKRVPGQQELISRDTGCSSVNWLWDVVDGHKHTRT